MTAPENEAPQTDENRGPNCTRRDRSQDPGNEDEGHLFPANRVDVSRRQPEPEERPDDRVRGGDWETKVIRQKQPQTRADEGTQHARHEDRRLICKDREVCTAENRERERETKRTTERREEQPSR